ncbi:response regulator [Pseudorhodobacter ferrugineus]|uniref:response regulator n=2 Tax=Pseudorhodobacter ferrugineus TaxID=77008 RepID=UPI00040CD1BE|nr:response regulator [Pseudorhodobacter ferrugineus]
MLTYPLQTSPPMPPPNGHGQKEEIKRQLDLLWSERWGRLPLTVFALLLTAIYLPLWVSLLCTFVDIGCELVTMRYMRALDPKRHRWRYRFVLACTFVMQLAYAIAPALIWQMNDEYAKAFAVGLVMATLMQLISARTIHMPFGYSGFAAATTAILIGNTNYWLMQSDYHGLAFSTLAAIGGLAYTLIAMLSNNRLHRSAALDRKAALESNKAKSRFLTQMSHELRTPLNAILGMGHAEQRRSKDALSQNRLSVLISAAEGLSTILDDILDMSAIEAGRLPIRPQPAKPQREIAATLALFQPAIASAGLWLTQDVGPRLDEVWMFDPQRLRQCMSNLLSNALKNTAQGGIHVSAQMVLRASEAPLLCVEIADTGPGIPTAMHKTLFEPFSQNRKPKAGADSNGLGLSICRTMAQQMGGDLAIAPNRPGQSGARFILTLQLGAAPPAPEANPPLIPAPPNQARAHAGTPMRPVGGTEAGGTSQKSAGLCVLVVDDIATNRLVASTYLRMLGATMIEAESGAQALAVLAGMTPDLILLDMNMPEMNGLETLAKIRALPAPAGKVPVIAMTANAMADHRDLYLSSGVDGYLAKPINPARIEAEIKAVLDKAQGPAAS